jgi:hypothetical protein
VSEIESEWPENLKKVPLIQITSDWFKTDAPSGRSVFDDIMKAKKQMDQASGYEPDTIIMSPFMYDRMDWIARKHDIFARTFGIGRRGSRIDFDLIVAPRLTRFTRWVGGKRRRAGRWIGHLRYKVGARIAGVKEFY